MLKKVYCINLFEEDCRFPNALARQKNMNIV